eukprot:scaffold1138_cov128-Cylindrotheca_fusiformis.AAC.37
MIAHLLYLLLAFSSFSVTFSLTSSSSKQQQRVCWKGLTPSGFRHPLDNDLTALVRSLPFHGAASNVVRRGLSLVEERLRLQLLSSSVKVSSKQLPWLEASFLEACEILAISPPELYVQSNVQANAYTLATKSEDGGSKKPILVVTSALLDQCTLPEIQAILGHELGHLKCEHSLYLSLGSVLGSALPIRKNLVQDWRLAAEYSCDRAALLVAQDIHVVNGAILKLYAGTGSQQDLNIESFIAQSEEYDELLKDASPLIKRSIRQERRTHPLPIRRLAELKKWEASDSYQKLLQRAAQLEQVMKVEST